jgi:hypothetical protein
MKRLPSARSPFLLRSFAALPLLAPTLFVSGCGGSGEDDQGVVSQEISAEVAARAATEEQFFGPAVRAYVGANVDTTAVQDSSGWYFRSECSSALLGAISKRGNPAADMSKENRWLDHAARNLTRATLAGDGGGHHVVLAGAVDCLLAASAMGTRLAAATRRTLQGNLMGVATWAFGDASEATWAATQCTPSQASHSRNEESERGWAGPACFAQAQRANLGDSQTEESGLAGAFGYLAGTLLAAPPALAAAWTRRGSRLLAWSISQGDQRTQGTPFPAAGLTANHQMRPNPYYSGGALVSLADALAVQRQVRAPMPEGFPRDRVISLLRDISGATTPDFRFTGAFDFVDAAGNAGTGATSYDAQTWILANDEPWSTQRSPFLPSDGVGPDAMAGRGTVAQYRHPTTGAIKGYVFNGPDVRAYTCDPNWAPGHGRCEAMYRKPLTDLWKSVGNQSAFGAFAPPTDRVDAAPMWATASGEMQARFIRGDRFWEYTCGASGCNATRSVTLGEHFGSLDNAAGWTEAAPPVTGVDAASVVYDPATRILRAYYFKGKWVWHERCDFGQRCRKQYVMTLGSLFSSVGGNPAGGADRLPEDRVDAITQFVDAQGRLTQYLFRGKQSWKYLCEAGACTFQQRMSLEDRWANVIGQERFATPLRVRTGVTDWGTDASSVFNSAYALGAWTGDAQLIAKYEALLALQRGTRSRETLFPSAYDATGWSFTTAPRAIPAAAGGPGATGFWPAHYCLEAGSQAAYWCTPHQRTRADNEHDNYWMNIFAARNHAMAFALQAAVPATGGLFQVLPAP